jgi:hypothetical protein
MPFQLNDASAGAQRMQIDNSANTEFGPATPSGPISFQGRDLLDGSYLAQQVARPAGMARFTGSVSLADGGQATISCGTSSGFGVADGSAGILSFSADKTQVTIFAYSTGSARTVDVSVF